MDPGFYSRYFAFFRKLECPFSRRQFLCPNASNLVVLRNPSFIQFKFDLESAINNVYNANPGTKLTYSFLLPKDASEVCFEKVSDGTRTRADSVYTQSFLNEKLTHNKANPYCIKVVNKNINVVLENKIINSKSLVELS